MLHAAPRRLADQNGIGRGNAFEPGGQVDGVADGLELDPEVISQGAYHHRTGVNTDPHFNRLDCFFHLHQLVNEF